jgi:hypothetical protein
MFLTWVAIVHSIDANGGLIFDLCHKKLNSGFFAQMRWVFLLGMMLKGQTLS